MSDINREQVLNGTFHKKLYQGYQKMKLSGLTKESAYEYKSIYESAPLSDILKEASLIFGEPLLGLSFYTKVICENKIPLHQFTIQSDKLKSFITENGDKMSDIMKEKYENSLSEIKSVMESRKNEIEFSSFNLTDEIESVIDEMCDDLYEYGNNANIPSVNSFFETVDIEHKILYGYYILQEYDENMLSNILHQNMVMTESVQSDAKKYYITAKSNVISSYLVEDSAIKDNIKKTSNRNLRNIILESSTENYSNVIYNIFTEKVESDDVSDYIGESAVMEMFDEDDRNRIFQEEFLDTRLVNASKAKYILEAALDVVYTEYLNHSDEDRPAPSIVKNILNADLTVKESADFLIEKINQMDEIVNIILESDDDHFFEYTRRGEATPTIRSQTGNLRETLPSSSGENKKKNNSSNTQNDTDEDDEEEPDTTSKKEEKPKEKVDPDQKAKSDDKSSEEPVKYDEPVKKGKPEMQKQSLTRKIQNKAIDMDVKMQKAAGNAGQKATELKNAGKAVLRLPGNILKKMKTGIEEWNTMDEEKRKEKILRPGYRTQIFKLLKTAIMYGAIWQWKKYMVIVTWICKHTILHPFFKASKQRSERLRNELTAELETEIAVTEEKINDANANGDQKQKYELIRIKKKLEAEKVRVSTNSKYI